MEGGEICGVVSNQSHARARRTKTAAAVRASRPGRPVLGRNKDALETKRGFCEEYPLRRGRTELETGGRLHKARRPQARRRGEAGRVEMRRGLAPALVLYLATLLGSWRGAAADVVGCGGFVQVR